MNIGEWWIEDRWTVTHADGEYGENHHECVVLARAISELVDEINKRCPEIEIQDDYDGDHHWLREDLANFETDDYEDYMRSHGIDHFIIDRALNMNQDHRVVGMRDYGWSAVRGVHVDTWTLNPNKMRGIGEGLLEIGHEMNVVTDDIEFKIEDFAKKKIFRATPRDLIIGKATACHSWELPVGY
jgi:hypothetical protein